MTPQRWERELEFLRHRYGEVQAGENMDWVLVKNVSLPQGWNRPTTDILVLIPPGYPSTPPDNCYVPERLALSGGGNAEGYGDGHGVLNGSWGRFSLHAERWRAHANVEDGDNLLTCLLAFEKRLNEVN